MCIAHGILASMPSARVRRSTPARSGRAGSSDAARTDARVSVDECDHPASGTARFEHGLRLADRHRPGAGQRQGLVDAAGGSGFASERDQGRPLVLAKVGAGVPSRLLRRAERSDEVVDELEGESEASCGVSEHAQRFGVGAAENRPRLQGGAERVHRGLVEGGIEGRSARGMPHGDAVLDVGELPGRRDHDRVVEERQKAVAGRIVGVGHGHQPERLVQQDVAGEDGGGVPEQSSTVGVGAAVLRAQPELSADVRHAAAHRVVVDHVVVHDERGVQQFERCRHRQGGRGVGVIGAERVEGCRDQRRPQPLAAVRRPRDGIRQRSERGAQLHGAIADPGQRPVDRDLQARVRRCRDHDARR